MATATRPTWKGSLKLSLVAIPIRVYPATSASEDIAFRQIHRRCHTPIRMKKWCPHCDEEVAADDIVKGYESSKGRFVLVEAEDIAGVRPTSTHVVDISHVMTADVIDPIAIERSYFMAPDTKAAGAGFAVVRDALEGKAAVGRLALHGREYLVAVLPRDGALLLHTLRTKGEVRDAKSIDALDMADVRVKPEEVRLARKILDSFHTARDLSDFTDHYQESLKAILKQKGEVEFIAPEDEAAPQKVVNLMDALRQSLERVSRDKKRPARAAAGGSRAAVRPHHTAKQRRAS